MKLLNKAVLFAFALSAVSGVAIAGGDKAKSSSDSSMGAAGSSSTGSSATGSSGSSASGSTGSFSSLDKDSNGYIDSSEASGVSGLDMKAADTDNDGRLSRSEYEAASKGSSSSRQPTGAVPGAGPSAPSGGGASGSGAGAGSGAGSGAGGGAGGSR